MGWNPPLWGEIDSVTPGGRPAVWAATGRSGGASSAPFASLNLAEHVGDDAAAVAANRDQLRRWAGASHLVVLSAVHGADVAVVDDAVIAAAEQGHDPVADAAVCCRPDVALLALGADCLTVAIAGDDDATVAVAHCGWQGLAADVVGATLRALESRGIRPVAVVLGPAICGACYPVPRERIEQLHDTCAPGVAEASVVMCPDGQPGIDVTAGVLVRLRHLGVPDDTVTRHGGCTAEDLNQFSYRRDGRTGRQGMLIARRGRMSP